MPVCAKIVVAAMQPMDRNFNMSPELEETRSENKRLVERLAGRVAIYVGFAGLTPRDQLRH
jgi:hypothetical protein